MLRDRGECDGPVRHRIGPVQEVTDRLREQIDAGITHLMLGVPSLNLDHLRRLAEEVAPALRSGG